MSAAQDEQLAERVREVERAILARTPEHDLDPSLERIADLVDLLGAPQRAFPVIHLTGTNGKTSTARMVDSLLRAFGLRTGRFTSPHLHRMQERITLEGTPLDDARFVRAYEDVEPYLDLVDRRHGARLSFFEVLVAMAYAAFADAPVDVAVVEVGMGGRWDATNVADGQVAVVTPVAVDHTAFLGSTPEQIAVEKAGIVKEGAVAVVAQQEVAVAEVLLRRAVEVGATVAREGLEFGVVGRSVAVGGQQVALRGLGGTYEDLFLPLHGPHQAHNAAVALAAVEAFLGGGAGTHDVEAVRAGFAAADSPGRLEVVRRSPTVVLDAAHNPAGAAAAAAALEEAFGFGRLVGVVSVMADKDVQGVLSAFEPVMAEVVVTQAATDRAMDVDELAAVAVDVFGEDRVEVVPRLDDAIEAAVRLAEEDGGLSGGVLVTGSVRTVGEARVLLGKG
jgi:dihydrofolate synthase/folylpolyglutamate synthase